MIWIKGNGPLLNLKDKRKWTPPQSYPQSAIYCGAELYLQLIKGDVPDLESRVAGHPPDSQMVNHVLWPRQEPYIYFSAD